MSRRPHHRGDRGSDGGFSRHCGTRMEFRSRVAGKGIAPDRQSKTAMTPDRWAEVEKRLHDGVQLAPADRAAFLDQIEDADVRLEVASLLAAGVPRNSLSDI